MRRGVAGAADGPRFVGGTSAGRLVCPRSLHQHMLPVRPGRAGGCDGRAIRMRLIVLASLWLLVAAAPVRAQVGFDRPGGDYTNFPVRNGDPVLCALRCERWRKTC